MNVYLVWDRGDPMAMEVMEPRVVGVFSTREKAAYWIQGYEEQKFADAPPSRLEIDERELDPVGY